MLPLKLDLKEILVDYNRFARAAKWQEYWFGRENNEAHEKPIFQSRKNKSSSNHTTPPGLKVMLNSTRSEIMDPMNRNNEEPNLPKEEIEALMHLIKLQKERVIIIKAADKGAGIVIINFQDYIKACYDHLLSSLPNVNSEEEPELYYEPSEI